MCGLRIRREYRKRLPRHRGLAIPTCITTRASRTCRQASRHARHARVVVHARIANLWFPLKSVVGKSFRAFPAHAHPALLRIWQEAHTVQPIPSFVTKTRAYTVVACMKFTDHTYRIYFWVCHWLPLFWFRLVLTACLSYVTLFSRKKTFHPLWVGLTG